VYTVLLDDGARVDASLRGRLKQAGAPVVIGDRVAVAGGGESAFTIESVEPRVTELVRRGRGGRGAKVLAANLDRVLAVASLVDPPATVETIDRLLAMIEASGIHPALVLNKVDLDGAAAAAGEIRPAYEAIGYRTFVVSARSGEGLAELTSVLCDGTSALVGASGVGKSSILNAIDPELELRTGELSGKTGTGRHTTVASRLLPLRCGGVVADTPGFGEVALWSVPPSEIQGCFPELREPATLCRFRSCTHVHEPECGVRAAVSEGRVRASRYRSYARLLAEAQEA
jgi:ribosome biogenesis GTPase